MCSKWTRCGHLYTNIGKNADFGLSCAVAHAKISAYAIGDRSKKTCQPRWERIPAGNKSCQSFSDLWEAYQRVFPPDTHSCVGKGERQTNHMERWYSRLRECFENGQVNLKA